MTYPVVKLQCIHCNVIVTRPKYSCVTGIEHGRGWTYICVECRGEMVIIEDETDPEEAE